MGETQMRSPTYGSGDDREFISMGDGMTSPPRVMSGPSRGRVRTRTLHPPTAHSNLHLTTQNFYRTTCLHFLHLLCKQPAGATLQ